MLCVAREFAKRSAQLQFYQRPFFQRSSKLPAAALFRLLAGYFCRPISDTKQERRLDHMRSLLLWLFVEAVVVNK